MNGMHSGQEWRERLLRVSRWSGVIAGGPGGQHRNRNATGVRLLHQPSGIVITATERRSQAANLQAALERLQQRLQAALQVDAPRLAGEVPPSSRSERRADKQRRAERKQLRAVVQGDE